MDRSELQRWTHPAVILVATDLHELDRLMPVAMAEARENRARVLLLHVIDTVVFSSDAAGLPYYNPAELLEEADKALLPWCEAARREGLSCDALVREGSPAQQIIAAARQFQADRLLLGTRSRSKLSKLLLGSVAEQVLRSVNLPVITVGPEAHLPVETESPRVILHATTLREASRPSAALACQIATSRKEPLVLLHVMPPADGRGQKQAEAGAEQDLDSTAVHELMSKLTEEMRAAGCAQVEPVTVHGNPFIEILAIAAERNAGLIVLGATRRSAFENLTRDRTVYRVLAHARCPVLTLREPMGREAQVHEEPAAMLHQ